MFMHNPRLLPAILLALATAVPAFAQEKAQTIPTEKGLAMGRTS